MNFIKKEEKRLKILKDKRLSDYRERQTWYSFNRGYVNHLCIECHQVFKKNESLFHICPNCKNDLINIGLKERVPRKNASNRVWSNYLKRIDRWKHYNEIRRKKYLNKNIDFR